MCIWVSKRQFQAPRRWKALAAQTEHVMPLGGRSLVLNTMPPDGSDEQLISAESSVRLPAVTSPKAASKVKPCASAYSQAVACTQTFGMECTLKACCHCSSAGSFSFSQAYCCCCHHGGSWRKCSQTETSGCYTRGHLCAPTYGPPSHEEPWAAET